MKTVKHTIFEIEKWRLKVLLKLKKKGFRKRFYRSDFFFEQILLESPIPKVGLDELISVQKIELEDFVTRNGNVTPYELVVMSSIACARGARHLLEIGTFDGNTTLQLALNTDKDAEIHTIDLPKGDTDTTQPVLESDIQFIEDMQKQKRKYQGHVAAQKITQHFGDSTCYDFSKFCKNGKCDFIFIDGGHSYQCVKSDTENALKILSKGGCILWHDFTPLFGGVYQFLLELSKELSLVHIEGTNLVLYRKEFL